MMSEDSDDPRFTRWRPAGRAAAVVVPLLICAILYGVRDSVTTASAALVLVLWVVAAAATGDRAAAILAAVSSGAWFDFFLTQPYLRFTINDSDDVEVTALLVLVSLAVTEIALWGYRQQARAARRSGYLHGVLSAARTVAEGAVPTPAVIDIVARQITEVLGADDCRFFEGPLHDPRIAVLDHDGVLTRQVHTVDVDRAGLPANEYIAIMVRRGPRVIGHFLVTAATHVSYPSREQRSIAVLLADQVGSALEG